MGCQPGFWGIALQGQVEKYHHYIAWASVPLLLTVPSLTKFEEAQQEAHYLIQLNTNKFLMTSNPTVKHLLNNFG